ncbi:jg17909 [Pararge aegeria aegeria]|uniref:Jg17909 protein n=1 Tax=Pararge aegeria aegeria TaxID=348720 RepID=A0A8S4SQS6_9NEOP|nr:jg17909 [Pararge aegeria aegeria]
MSYGILLGGNAADIGTIFVLKKRDVRAIYKMGPRESFRDKFKDVKTLTVFSQYIFENLMGEAGGREAALTTGFVNQEATAACIIHNSNKTWDPDSAPAARQPMASTLRSLRNSACYKFTFPSLV